MNLAENYKQFPIKFYENPDGTVYYENAFLEGTGKTLIDAMNKISNKNLDWDIPYYFDDVMDIQIGSFIPAYNDRKVKGRKYLGKIELKLDLNPTWKDSEHSVTYLSKHREELSKHYKYVNDLKRQKAKEDFINNLKSKLKNVVRKISGVFKKDYQYEMFFPYKTRKDLICSHCGSVIPTATYYEEYEGQNYHLECIWDKICNKKDSNEYDLARKYFLSLQKFIGKWPANGLDIEEDYLTDLDLVKTNDRKTCLNEVGKIK